MRVESFDPTWLVELARKQRPKGDWLPDALSACTRVWGESRAYFYFHDPGTTQKVMGEIIALEHPKRGTIVIDVTEDQNVIGVELVYRL